jgi:hypothetical protein
VRSIRPTWAGVQSLFGFRFRLRESNTLKGSEGIGKYYGGHERSSTGDSNGHGGGRT